MNDITVVLFHNEDDSYLVFMERKTDKEKFNLIYFNPNGYQYKQSYNYAYQLSGFLNCDFREVK